MPFEEVSYWDELSEIMEWSKTHVCSTLYICWGAQAGIYKHFGIHKEDLPSKLFGVYEQEVQNGKPMLMRGLDERFYMPHSRHMTISIFSSSDIRNMIETPYTKSMIGIES